MARPALAPAAAGRADDHAADGRWRRTRGDTYRMGGPDSRAWPLAHQNAPKKANWAGKARRAGMNRDDLIALFLARNGFPPDHLEPLAQDASFRRYLRIRGDRPAVLM